MKVVMKLAKEIDGGMGKKVSDHYYHKEVVLIKSLNGCLAQRVPEEAGDDVLLRNHRITFRRHLGMCSNHTKTNTINRIRNLYLYFDHLEVLRSVWTDDHINFQNTWFVWCV